MSAVDQAVKKVRQSLGSDLDCFLSAFPSQLLFRSKIVPNAGGFAEYVGFAPAGAKLYEPVWQIKKLIYDVNNFNTDVVFANGSAEFKYVFDAGSSQYASYQYSVS